MDQSISSDKLRWQVIAFVVVVVVVLFGGMWFADWLVDRFAAQRRLSRNEFVLWRGDVWFAEGSWQFGQKSPVTIKTFDPGTGVIHSTGITIQSDVQKIVADEDRLWIITTEEVLETDGATIIRRDPEMLTTVASSIATAFLLNGRITVVKQASDGGEYLYTLSDGKWRKGEQIVLPWGDRTWAMDEERNEVRLVPRTTGSGVTTRGTGCRARVRQIGQTFHVIASSYVAGKPVIAYRPGFDFVATNEDAPSALAPANAEPDATCWYRLDVKANPRPIEVHGECYLATTESPYLWKPLESQPGCFQSASIQFAESTTDLLNGSLAFLSSLNGDEFRLIHISDHDTVTFFRLVDDRLERLPHTLPGNADSTLAHWRLHQAAESVAWALSLLILLTGARWLLRTLKTDCYEFGNQSVALAPLLRRGIARGIDLGFQWTPLLCVITWSTVMSKPEPLVDWWNGLQPYRDLLTLRGFSALRNIFWGPSPPRLDPITAQSVFAAFIWFAMVFTISTIMQAWQGYTPGKWLCGLRVVRATLRPCGLARSLVRELLLFVDTLLFPALAVAAILLSKNCQRIGDSVGDTIVIDARM